MRLVTPVSHRGGRIVDLHGAIVTVHRGRSRHWPRARAGRPERQSHAGSNQRRTGNKGEISTPGNKGHSMPPLLEKLGSYGTIAGDLVTVTPSLSPSSSAQTPASPEPEPCRVLITASLAEPAWPGDPGEHRRCPPGLPCLVLPHASAAVTHAGYGTVAACAPPPGYGPGRVRDGSGGAEAGAGMRRTWTQTASVAATGRRTGRTWPRVTATARPQAPGRWFRAD